MWARTTRATSWARGLVSLIYSFFILKAAEWLWQRYAPGRWPKLYAAQPVLFPSWARVLKVARPWRWLVELMSMQSPSLPASLPPEAELPPRPFAWVTWTVIASTVGVYVLQLIELHRYRDDVVGNALAFGPDALRDGRYYTLLTYAWAHAVDMGGGDARYFFWLHLVANMIPLACVGPALEEMLGHGRYLGLYLGGAIASVLIWYFFNSDAGEPIIGASGAVFAVIGGIGVAVPRERVIVLILFLLPVRMYMGVVALVTCALEALFIVMQYIPLLAPYSLPEVAHSAHLGGAAFAPFTRGGCCRGLIMSRKRVDKRQSPAKDWV